MTVDLLDQSRGPLRQQEQHGNIKPPAPAQAISTWWTTRINKPPTVPHRRSQVAGWRERHAENAHKTRKKKRDPSRSTSSHGPRVFLPANKMHASGAGTDWCVPTPAAEKDRRLQPRGRGAAKEQGSAACARHRLGNIALTRFAWTTPRVLVHI